MIMSRRVLTKATHTAIAAYDLSRLIRNGSLMERAAVFPSEASPCDHAAAPDLECAAYTTDDALICVGRDGGIRWRSDFDAAPERYMNGAAACAFSLRGDVVWLYRPDLAMKGPGHTDQWLAFDAATGAVLGQVDLGSTGHGAYHFVHPDGEQILLNVGQGQDGARVYRARLDDTGIVVSEYVWDATLFDLSPDGGRVMTVREVRGGLLEELVIRTFPEGREDVVVSAEALGYDEDRYETFFIGYIVGYLDADTAIVSVHGELAEDEDDEEAQDLDFHHNQLVDVRTGRVLGPMPSEFFSRNDVMPLGDRSWLTVGSNGGWYRHTL
ncbi:hypothetical protein E1200_26145 [Actinomadura sp. GC306]|uniref:hypothetical protein n=1 Tax=Actinomadura sp. GC306 TaxID=2530367 RepID=UPI001043ACF8|nr:hypothetical protein [Actinomadura sp. GC306]TDC62342.1 hypothetical protein E1200_26145 [Actinomadura sp. GC306]